MRSAWTRSGGIVAAMDWPRSRKPTSFEDGLPRFLAPNAMPAPLAALAIPASTERLDQTPDHLVETDAFGARGQIERHAMTQDRRRQGHHILDRGCEAAFHQGACTGRQHQRLAGAWSWSPGHMLTNG